MVRVIGVAVMLVSLAVVGLSGRTAAHPIVMQPSVAEYQQLTTSETPPTQAQCASVGRRCFRPQATQSAYNLGPLYRSGFDGRGQTIAIVDSYGSDTMAHDLHVYNNAFGLQHMCGEEGVTCSAGMPTFRELKVQGAPSTSAPPPNNGTYLEARSAWAIEVALDVETAHAIAPMANILLVTTPTAETLGVQGFPDMMNAEQYVIDHHLATVISQSFASAEDAFGSAQSLLSLRHAYIAAAQSGVSVLAASGDGGTTNYVKQPLKNPAVIPYPSVEWPASDPLVTGVGGTYLCTDPNAGVNDAPVATAGPPGKCASSPSQTEVGWTFSGGGFSDVFGKPTYQNELPAGSTQIGAMRGVPDVGLQASAGTGAYVYLSLPPYDQSGLWCGSGPCSSGWYVVGGTSLSTPEWAGMVAIADQINGGGLGLLNPALYKIAADPARYAADFNDVTTGKNQTDPMIPGYPSTAGWDPVTGLGTPNAAVLLPDLVRAIRGN